MSSAVWCFERERWPTRWELRRMLSCPNSQWSIMVFSLRSGKELDVALLVIMKHEMPIWKPPVKMVVNGDAPRRREAPQMAPS